MVCIIKIIARKSFKKVLQLFCNWLEFVPTCTYVIHYRVLTFVKFVKVRKQAISYFPEVITHNNELTQYYYFLQHYILVLENENDDNIK